MLNAAVSAMVSNRTDTSFSMVSWMLSSALVMAAAAGMSGTSNSPPVASTPASAASSSSRHWRMRSA